MASQESAWHGVASARSCLGLTSIGMVRIKTEPSYGLRMGVPNAELELAELNHNY